MSKMASCIFCKIIKGDLELPHRRDLLIGSGEIPSMKLFESEKTLAFMDIGPLALGHSVREQVPLNIAKLIDDHSS